jgi:hypothetical protein
MVNKSAEIKRVGELTRHVRLADQQSGGNANDTVDAGKQCPSKRCVRLLSKGIANGADTSTIGHAPAKQAKCGDGHEGAFDHKDPVSIARVE